MRADRLLSLLLILQARGQLPARELATLLEVSERTIYRDLDALSAAGIPIVAERGPGGGCRLPEGYRSSLAGLTAAEMQALIVASTPGPLTVLHVGERLQHALQKLTTALPHPTSQVSAHADRRILLDPTAWFRGGEATPHVRTLEDAVWQERRIRMSYRGSDGRVSERLLDPYGLVAKAGVWYLVAAAGGELRVFRVSRLRSAELTADHFTRPANFDLTAYWRAWCTQFETSQVSYPIQVRTAPEIVPYLAQTLGDRAHDLVEGAGRPDGAGWISLALTFEDIWAARAWALSYGAQIEVLEPTELRNLVVMTLQDLTALYTATDL